MNKMETKKTLEEIAKEIIARGNDMRVTSAKDGWLKVLEEIKKFAKVIRN